MSLGWLWEALSSDWAIAVVGVAAAYWGLLCTIYLQRQGNRDAYARDLELGFSDLYHHWLGRGLGWIDAVLGPRLVLSGRGLSVCIGISLTYALGGFLFGWAGGGPAGVGEFPAMPPNWPAWARWTAVAVLVLLASVAALAPRIDAACVARLRRSRWHVARDRAVAIYRGSGALFAGGIVLAALLWQRESLLLSDVAVALAFAAAFAVAFAVAFVGTVVGTVAFAVALAVAVAVVGTAAFAVAFAVALAVVGTIAFAVVGTIAVAFAVVVTDSVIGWPSLYLLLFLGLLPIANAVLDWLSLAMTRWLGRELYRRSWSWLRLAAHTGIDLAAALIFLAAAAFLLPFVIETFNLLMVSAGGEKPLDLAPLLARVLAPESWADRAWVAVMLFTTLLPTFAHLVVLFAGMFTSELLPSWRLRTVERLRTGTPGARVDMNIAAYLTLRWPLAALPAVLVFVALADVAQAIWHMGLAEQLHAVAEAGMLAADRLFGG